MSTQEEQNNEQKEMNQELHDNTQVADEQNEAPSDANAEEGQPKDELAEQKEKYLRLYSEFENFRRRTNKEKLEMITTANERLVVDLLPILDDFERAMKSVGEAEETKSIKEGIDLIYNKLHKTLENKGLKPINATGEVFDAELHEAITQIPSPSEDMKGKVIDEVEKGYYLGEKVIRYSKVVIGA